MLLFLCSFAADSMSRSMSFWPSTIATRSSSACVALKSMRFICSSPARTGRTNQCLMCRLVSHHGVLDHENALVVCRLGAPRCRTRRICRFAGGALFYYYLVNFHWLDNQPPLRLRVPARSDGLSPSAALEPGTGKTVFSGGGKPTL